MKTTIVIYGSSTGSCQSIAETIASKLGVEAVDVANIDDATIASHENLLLGTSTWGAGEMQDDWYDGVKTLKSAGLAGKTVALFGCGDSESYPDTFCGGMKELYDAAVEAGATVCLVFLQMDTPMMTVRLLRMTSSWDSHSMR